MLDSTSLPLALRDLLLSLRDPHRRHTGLEQARKVVAQTTLAQLRERRPHLMRWARKPQTVAPSAFDGQTILGLSALLALDAIERGEPVEEQVRRLIGGFLHPEMHVQDSWHPEREFYARLGDRWSRPVISALLALLSPEDRELCLLETDVVPWPWLAAHPSDAVLRRAVDELGTWTRKPDYDEQEVVDGLVAVGAAIRPLLIEALTTQAPPQRHLLIQTLAALNAAEAAPAWVHLLSDSRADLRAIAVQSLAALGEAVALEPLRAALGSRRKGTRHAAAQALAALPQSAATRATAAARLDQERDELVRTTLQPLLADAAPAGQQAWHALRELGEATPERRQRPLSVYRNPVVADPEDSAFFCDAAEQMIKEPMTGHLHLWEQTLRIFQAHPAAPWAAVDVILAFTRHDAPAVEAHLKMLDDPFAEALREPVVYALEHHNPRVKATLLAWLIDHDVPALHLHLDALEDTSALVRDVALRGVVAAGDEAVPPTAGLLGSRKKTTRAAAATALRRLASPVALDAIDIALDAERDAEVRELLQRAREACAGTRTARVPALHRAWDPDAREDVSALLTALRDLLHDPLDALTFPLLCNLLDRAAQAGSLKLALEYVTGVLNDAESPWDINAPWHWSGDDDLRGIFTDELLIVDDWLTAHALFHETGERWVQARLKDAERRSRIRPFPPGELHTARAALRACWRLCDEHDLDPTTLELRVDGGAARRGTTATPVTTALIVRGFAVTLGREAAFIEGDGLPAGLRLARLPLPADHPARDRFNLGARDTHLDLRPLLRLGEPIDMQ